MGNWMDDKTYGKIVNVEFPGENITVSCQGKPFLYQDGFTGDVPVLVKEALNDAWFWDYDKNDIGIDQERKKVKRFRFLFVEMDRPKDKPSEEKAMDELIMAKDKKEKAAFGAQMKARKEEKSSADKDAGIESDDDSED